MIYYEREDRVRDCAFH